MAKIHKEAWELSSKT